MEPCVLCRYVKSRFYSISPSFFPLIHELIGQSVLHSVFCLLQSQKSIRVFVNLPEKGGSFLKLILFDWEILESLVRVDLGLEMGIADSPLFAAVFCLDFLLVLFELGSLFLCQMPFKGFFPLNY